MLAVMWADAARSSSHWPGAMTERVGSLQSAVLPLVLASSSAARRRLLEAAGLHFRSLPARVDEDAIKHSLRSEGVSAQDAAVALAETKAARVALGLPPETLVVAADQILACDGRWFDKPADRAAARSQLQALAGRAHELATAVVVFRAGTRIWHHVDTARLWMRPLGEAFVDAYLDVAGDTVLDSVGAYHLEDVGAHLFARVAGDAFTVQGLPLLPLLQCLRDQGLVLR